MAKHWNKPNESNSENGKAGGDRAFRAMRAPRFGGLGYDPLGGKDPIPSVERLDLGGIPGGDLGELTCARPLHSEPRAVNETLADTVDRVVAKVAAGELDYQAVGIIDAWYGEIAELAKLQAQKESLRAQTVQRAKRAADGARRAVDEERARREEEIRGRCRLR